MKEFIMQYSQEVIQELTVQQIVLNILMVRIELMTMQKCIHNVK